MDQAVVTKLLQDAKTLFDLGQFNILRQADFFAAMEAQIPPAPEPAPPPTGSPAPAPATTIVEGSDGVYSTATVGGTP